METNAIIKINGYKALVKELGEVQAEKFISLVQQEHFDYTEWQKKLWIEESVEATSRKAMQYKESKDFKR
ncbi:MAG: hypothetical protein GW805_13420 [Ignavibacteria bacterium]|nr:hypothetical protein [Ignavibacteria bacterium]OIO17395.1 MAG: hypothetical protein AUJ54_09840 [Ignavibacteria bacterium CG1_02_37_35]